MSAWSYSFRNSRSMRSGYSRPSTQHTIDFGSPTQHAAIAVTSAVVNPCPRYAKGRFSMSKSRTRSSFKSRTRRRFTVDDLLGIERWEHLALLHGFIELLVLSVNADVQFIVRHEAILEAYRCPESL